MPTYDYECEACTQTIEIVQSFHDEPKTQCPSCGKEALRRIISGGIGIVFKGSGFYAKDSVASSAANKSVTEKKSKEHTDSKSENANAKSSSSTSSSETTSVNQNSKGEVGGAGNTSSSSETKSNKME